MDGRMREEMGMSWYPRIGGVVYEYRRALYLSSISNRDREV